MKIETKFNCGDTIYYFKNNQIVSLIVYEIKLEVVDHQTRSIRYLNNSSSSTLEKDAFITKQEAAETWLETQGLVAAIKEL
jgi:hypothetical protein